VDPTKGLSDAEVLQFPFISFHFLFSLLLLTMGSCIFSISLIMMLMVSNDLITLLFQVVQHARLYGKNGMSSVGPCTDIELR